MSNTVSDDTRDTRILLWQAGFRPVPVYTGDKRPFGNDWRDLALLDPPACVGSVPHPHAMNTGILADGLRPIDVDVDDAAAARAIWDLALRMLGGAPARTRSNSPRILLLYRAADGEPPKRVLKGRLGKIEILGKGQQFVVFWHHPSGAMLHWQDDRFPGAIRRDELIVVGENQIDEFLKAAADLIEVQDPAPAKNVVEADEHTNPLMPEPDSIAEASAALAVIPGDGGDYDRWIKIGLATWSATNGHPDGLAAWQDWSAKSPKYDPAACRSKWSSFSKVDRISIGTLIHEARQVRPTWDPPLSLYRHGARVVAHAGDVDPEADDIAPASAPL